MPSLRLDRRGDDDVHRQHEVDLPLARLLEDGAREGELVVLDLRGLEVCAACGEERVGHGAADEERVHLLEERVEHGDLVAHLRAAEDCDVRLLRLRHELPERRDLLLEEEAAAALAEELRHRVNACMRAVDCAERVVDVDVAELREVLGEALVVLLLFGVEAEVLEEHQLPGAQVVDDLLRRIADAVFRHVHLDAEELREPKPHGLHR